MSGTVSGVAGGLANVDVTLYRWADDGYPDYVTFARTHFDGTYSLLGLPDGKYTLSIAGRYGYVSQWLGGASSPGSAETFTIASAGSVVRDIALALGGAVSGRVTNADDLPIEEVEVQVLDRASATQKSGYTDSNGEYEISGLPAGDDYTLHFSAPWGSDYVHQYWNNQASRNLADFDISVIAGETTTGRDAVLQRGATVTGTLIDATGEPIPSIGVGLVIEGEYYPTYNAGSDENGEFVLSGVAPGSYTLSFTDYSWPRKYKQQWWQGASLFEDAIDFVLSGSESSSLGEIELMPEPEMTSVVGKVSGSGEPLQDVEVYLYNDDFSYYAHVDGEGGYRFEWVEPGSYKLRFSPYDEDHLEQWYPGSASEEDAAEFVVAEGPNEVPDALLARGAKLQGQITYSGSPAGRPLADQWVDLCAGGDPECEDPLNSAPTDGDGNYTFRRLQPGEYYLRVFYGDLTHTTDRIVVPEGESVTHSFQVPAGASVSGTVTTAEDLVVGTHVKVVSKSGRTAASTRTDAQGEYSIAGLLPGSYTVGAVGRSIPDRAGCRRGPRFARPDTRGFRAVDQRDAVDHRDTRRR